MEWIPIVIVVGLVLIFLVGGYLKAPPDQAYIVSGLGKKRVLVGKAGWHLLFFERVDKLSLQVMQIDIKTSEAVPTNEFINVRVDGVANVKISSSPEMLKKAAEALLNKKTPEIVAIVTQVMEGNMREIVGSVGLKEMVQDRQGVAKKITENVVPDMEKLGLEVVNFNIQNFTDNANTIENLGIDNVEKIRKDAQIAKANAQRDISIAEAQARQETNRVKVETDKQIAKQNADLEIEQAEMKRQADIKKAEADAAYLIQEQAQRKTIEIETANANIAKTAKEAELAEQRIAIKEKELDAEIRKQADAMKYRAEKEAEAELIRRTKEAEAGRVESEQKAIAMKAEAEARKYAMLQEAEGIKARGDAEAEAIEKKALAQSKMQNASILEMYFKAMPEIVKNAAEPLAKTDKIVMYGDGNSTKLMKDVMHSTNQIVDGVKEATGIDVTSMLNGFIGGKVALNSASEGTAEPKASAEPTEPEAKSE